MPYNILLVEDEESVQEMYKIALAKEGFNVDMASDGDVALKKLLVPNVNYHLILLDVMLPKLDGVSIMKKIKQPNSPSKNIPVMLLTNLGLDEVVQEATQLGAVKCLIKSNTLPQQVVEEIKSFFTSRPTTTAQ